MQRDTLADGNERMMAELSAMSQERHDNHRRSYNLNADTLRSSMDDLATRPLDAEFFLDEAA